MRRLCLWSGCVALFTAYACGSPPLDPRKPTPGVFHFTVESFNVEAGKESDPATVAAVGAADADIVCLQEAGGGWPDALRAAYSDRYAYQLYMPDPDGHPTGGFAVLSRYPVTDLGAKLDQSGDWHFHPAWSLRVNAPGATLDILQVHLRAVFSGQSNVVTSYLRVGADHLASINDFTAQPADPITLVLGDFNEEAGGEAVHKLEEDGFRDVLPLFRPGQPTWRHPSLANQFNAAIDHVMFDAMLDPLDARVLDKGNSDHMPLVASFELAQDR